MDGGSVEPGTVSKILHFYSKLVVKKSKQMNKYFWVALALFGGRGSGALGGGGGALGPVAGARRRLVARVGPLQRLGRQLDPPVPGLAFVEAGHVGVEGDLEDDGADPRAGAAVAGPQAERGEARGSAKTPGPFEAGRGLEPGRGPQGVALGGHPPRIIVDQRPISVKHAKDPQSALSMKLAAHERLCNSLRVTQI